MMPLFRVSPDFFFFHVGLYFRVFSSGLKWVFSGFLVLMVSCISVLWCGYHKFLKIMFWKEILYHLFSNLIHTCNNAWNKKPNQCSHISHYPDEWIRSISDQRRQVAGLHSLQGLLLFTFLSTAKCTLSWMSKNL